MAAEFSPGREPGVRVKGESSAREAATENETDQNIRPDIGRWPGGVVRLLAEGRFHSIS